VKELDHQGRLCNGLFDNALPTQLCVKVVTRSVLSRGIAVDIVSGTGDSAVQREGNLPGRREAKDTAARFETRPRPH
jgi:hypothetical protein